MGCGLEHSTESKLHFLILVLVLQLCKRTCFIALGRWKQNSKLKTTCLGYTARTGLKKIKTEMFDLRKYTFCHKGTQCLQLILIRFRKKGVYVSRGGHIWVYAWGQEARNDK
jgi:hypothetical protein